MPAKSLDDETLQQTAEVFLRNNKSQVTTADELGISRSALQSRLRRAKVKGFISGDDAPIAKPVTTTNGAKKKGRSFDEFLAEYDKDVIVPRKIRAALAELPDDGWEFESQFIRDAGISQNDIANYREKFAAHIVFFKRDGKRAWVKDTQVAAAMRAKLP